MSNEPLTSGDGTAAAEGMGSANNGSNLPASALPTPAGGAAASEAGVPRRWLWPLVALALAGLGGSVLVWQKVNGMQQQLARQSADSGAQAAEARAVARQSQDLAMQTAAKLSVTEARLAEVALQRSQLEELMQSLSRSRDENLVVDIDSSLRLAQQQAQLTGSVEPLMAALKSADQRVARSAQPRLAALQRAIARDTARIKATAVADTPSLLAKLDELVALADELPIANAVGPAATPSAGKADAGKRRAEEPAPGWWERLQQQVVDELRGLVRVSRVEDPDAALLNPEQSFFLRENLKLRLLNARLGLLSRQIDSARGDLGTAAAAMARYFDTNARKTQTAQALLQQVQGQMRALDLPRIDDTLAALATAAGGR